ncbi:MULTISPECIES: exodeoxyribonuclease VII large subunit [Chryseobacterium]|uniref:Exonuclease VII, large subunit n=1 Tax=Chryseobacterium profundimaris TaxID=1387275 RepID=A0ABY1NLB3_9FLAO|nr:MULTISPECIES: exodeoxyribonuclease VII large subunit [Chryseobacterium]SMP12534.1 Exonuclease VII, large subunit [Chryseobacterium profundimaris]
MDDQEATYPIYSPASVIGIFSNALKLNATVNLIYLKGRYAFGGGKSYGNYYYDLLFSEGDHTSIGIRISSLLRSKITNNEIFTLRGFIEKSIKNSSIELRFVVDEIVQQEERSISEEELERYALIQKKLEIGSKNLETLIRDKMLKDEKVRVANIYGNNAIVQKDFFEGLDVSRKYFDISDHSCNITSSTAIISKMNEVSGLDYDIVALVRGGGDRQSMETFNDLSLSELFITMKPVTVTAIGHTVDETLLDKLADKRFHLPHDYGAGLHAIAEKLSHERSNSRTLLIDEVKKDVTKQFSEQVETLEKQLKKKNEEFTEAQKIYKEQVENHNKTFTDQLKVRNEEFQKLQLSSGKQLEDLQKNFQEQQKQRQTEMENYKKEIAVLHEKNVQSAINEKTASLRILLENVRQDNVRLNQEVHRNKINYGKIIIVFLIALIIGFFLAKLV